MILNPFIEGIICLALGGLFEYFGDKATGQIIIGIGLGYLAGTKLQQNKSGGQQ